MPGVQLYDYQYDALVRLSIGKILNGDVGSGKSRTGLAFYYELMGGRVNSSKYIPMKHSPKDLYIITTPLKRDKLEWEEELANFRMTPHKDLSRYKHNIIIDSWNNIKKYTDVTDAFFIFDEQRVIGYGAWSKAFLKITRRNQNPWILLTATPGDTWSDYIPVFIANGHYRNKTDFERQHAVWSRYTKFPKIEKYINEGRLMRLKRDILIDMEDARTTTQHHEYIETKYDRLLYADVSKRRWNPYLNKPMKNAGEFCGVLRRIVNSDPSRVEVVVELLKKHPKAIIFYNYNYELGLLRKLFGKDHKVLERNEEVHDVIPDEDYNWVYLVDETYLMSEWNGHKHEPIPDGDRWTYLVQYLAGAEGWNCIVTDTIIFYSQNYSYRITHQAGGRIDRMNTPFKDLFYYHLRSNSKIDSAIKSARNKKKKFNERSFAPEFPKEA